LDDAENYLRELKVKRWKEHTNKRYKLAFVVKETTLNYLHDLTNPQPTSVQQPFAQHTHTDRHYNDSTGHPGITLLCY
jgi:hypothetical protein